MFSERTDLVLALARANVLLVGIDRRGACRPTERSAVDGRARYGLARDPRFGRAPASRREE